MARVLREAIREGNPSLSAREAHDRVIVMERGSDDYGFSHFSYHKGVAPSAVAFPSSTEEVSCLMRACALNRLNVIGRGGGTSLEGQVLPLAPSNFTGDAENFRYSRPTVVLDMQKMSSILEINPRDLDIRVQAGVGWANLVSVLKPYGLMFPVDPGPGARELEGPPYPALCTCCSPLTTTAHSHTRARSALALKRLVECVARGAAVPTLYAMAP